MSRPAKMFDFRLTVAMLCGLWVAGILFTSGALLFYTAMVVPVQIFMWDYSDPCNMFPTLYFDVVVDVFFMVKPSRERTGNIARCPLAPLDVSCCELALVSSVRHSMGSLMHRPSWDVWTGNWPPFRTHPMHAEIIFQFSLLNWRKCKTCKTPMIQAFGLHNLSSSMHCPPMQAVGGQRSCSL
jgi:hypothetical protein